MAQDDERQARFKREAEALAALNHPNIITLYAVEHIDDVHFITMELVKGTTLSERIKKNGMPLPAFSIPRFLSPTLLPPLTKPASSIGT